MKTVTVRDKTFELSISSETIQKKIEELAGKISVDLKGKCPLFICVLNGSFIFTADLFKSFLNGTEVAHSVVNNSDHLIPLLLRCGA